VAPWVSRVRYFLVGLSAVGAAALGPGPTAVVATSRGAPSVLATPKDASVNGAVVPGAPESLE
jgi:hypothetical protein